MTKKEAREKAILNLTNRINEIKANNQIKHQKIILIISWCREKGKVKNQSYEKPET